MPTWLLEQFDQRIAHLSSTAVDAHRAALVGVAVVSTLFGAMSMGSFTTDPAVASASVMGAGVGAPLLFEDDAPHELLVDGQPLADADVAVPVQEVGPFQRVLTGTAVTDQPHLDAAMFRQPEGSFSRLYRRGDLVDGYRIDKIEKRRVTLVDPSGQRWVSTLALYGEGATDAAPVVEAGPVVITSLPSAAPGGDTVRIRRRLFRRMVASGIAPSGDLTPRSDPSGVVTGFEMRVGPGSVADRLGLEDGDVVTAVAGVSAREMSSPNEVLGEMWDKDSVCLDIERRGVVFDMCYRHR